MGSHPDYRVYMSAEPASSPTEHIIPQGILESSIKITNEPPTGMMANLHKALDNFNQVQLVLPVFVTVLFLYRILLRCAQRKMNLRVF